MAESRNALTPGSGTPIGKPKLNNYHEEEQ